MPQKNAYTLIELSIVLIVIGLLIIGVSSGSSMIKQARMQSVINELSNITTSINTFKTIYNAYPGDFSNASSFWLSSTCTAASVTAGCNGNADGNIDASGSTSGSEQYRAAQHLSLAGFTSGTYAGTNSSADQISSKYPNGIYSIYYMAILSSLSQNAIQLGTFSAGNSSKSLLLATDTHDIDVKIDDGFANSGQIYGVSGTDVTSTNCSYALGGAGIATYNISTTTTACILIKPINQ
jgi:prepilin-type N-terminal cleavage/methylation domain-containing protein